MADRPLSAEERAEILKTARRSLEDFLGIRPYPPEPPRFPVLVERRGVFVSLHAGEELRGCIGNFRSDVPLGENVRAMAVAAAAQDTRFEPVSAEELPRIRIEVSVLSPLTPIASPDEVEVGRHGLMVSRGRSRGVLLPQVATEHHWNRETFLDQTCLKAGLDPAAWRRGKAVLEVFTAEVFEEERPGGS